MSAEFTPESERQRLQFLVSPNLSQLTRISAVDLPSRRDPSHSRLSYAARRNVFPAMLGPSFLFFALKAYMQPQLLGNEFTHLEFPRRVQRKEVGKRMLYRDFTMSGWWVKHIH